MLNITIFQKDEITSSLKLEYYNNSKEFPIIHPLGTDTIGRLSSISLKDISAVLFLFYINEETINSCDKAKCVDQGRSGQEFDTKSLMILFVQYFYQQMNN